MAGEQALHETLTTGASFQGTPTMYQDNVPDYISANLQQGFKTRPYQREAFGRFVYYLETYSGRPKDVPIKLLFHMATGSGKTLIMAGLIIYLYKQGYRNFLFFVNSTNIINKTKDNFLNPHSSKYLFAESIEIDGERISMKEVENFSAANQQDINVVFSTIQGLHMRLNTPRENSLTYEDFTEQKVVLISDEAHHINAETKKGKDLNQTELIEVTSWEQTVTKIYQANKENVLLEFTATADLTHPEVEKKYKDKVIFDYPLREFRKDGYSKEVKVLQADLNDLDRALQALLLSQYRLKVFAKHKKLVKPVLLFKSKTIKESQSFFDAFADKIKHLDAKDLLRIKDAKDKAEVLQNAFDFFDELGVSLKNLAAELREDFSLAKCVAVNSKEESEEKQIAVNSLEDQDNEYRAVFAVDKLNEGWDVLNLFDIVRLYNTRDGKPGKPGATTMSEAQLIGRGARYCPFQITDDQPLFQRKYDVFDDRTEQDLKICEELYYHAAYNPRYIEELNRALEETGIKAREAKKCQLTLKLGFQDTTFYKAGHVFMNEQQKYAREDVFGIPFSYIETRHKASIATGYSSSSAAFGQQKSKQLEKGHKDLEFISFGLPVIRKAIDRLEFFRFDNLKRYLPNLDSINQFVTDPSYLGKLKVEVEGPKEQLEHLGPDQLVEIAMALLQKLSNNLQADKVDYKGTKEFKPYLIKDTIKDKTLNIVHDGGDAEYGIAQTETTNESLRLDLSKKDWYVFNDNYGTSEEKYFVRYVNKVYDKFAAKYDHVYLIRNERHFKIYTFNEGRAIEPDFVLFLVKEDPKTSMHYQVFIEPKGSHLLKHDEWKESFLKSLKKEHRIEQLWKDREYVIWGMPFYNETERKAVFETAFEDLT